MRDGQPPPESAAEKIKKQILKVGDGLEFHAEDDLPRLARMVEYHFTSSTGAILEGFRTGATEQPYKMPYYAALISLLTNPPNAPPPSSASGEADPKEEEAGEKETVGRIVMTDLVRAFKKSVDERKWREIRLLIHLFAHLVITGTISVQSYLELLQSFLSVVDELGVSAARAERVVVCVGEALIRGGSVLHRHDSKAVDALLAAIEVYVMTRQARKDLVSPYGGCIGEDQPEEEDTLTHLHHALGELRANDFAPPAFIPRIHTLFPDRVSDPKGEFVLPAVMVPPEVVEVGDGHGTSETKAEGWATCEIELFDDEIVPSPSTTSGWILRQLVHDTISIFEINRKECARILLEFPNWFESGSFKPPPNVSLPPPSSSDSATPPSTWSLESLIVSSILSTIIVLPAPQFQVAYYTSLLIELCKLSPSTVAPPVGKSARKLYAALDQGLDVECSRRFAEWLSQHLSNFGFQWLWKDWVPDLELPRLHPKPSFIRRVVELETRLSYHDRVKGTLPEPMREPAAGIIPAEAEAPRYDYEDPEHESYNTAATLQNLFRTKTPPETVLKNLSGFPLQPANGPLTTLTRSITVQTLLFIGARSFSHFLNATERYLPLLRGIATTDAERMDVLTAVGRFWRESGQMRVIIADKLMQYGIVGGEDVVRWVFSTGSWGVGAEAGEGKDGEEWMAGQKWDLLRMGVDKVNGRVVGVRRKIVMLEAEEEERKGGRRAAATGMGMDEDGNGTAGMEMDTTPSEEVSGAGGDDKSSASAALAAALSALSSLQQTQKAVLVAAASAFVTSLLPSHDSSSSDDEPKGLAGLLGKGGWEGRSDWTEEDWTVWSRWGWWREFCRLYIHHLRTYTSTIDALVFSSLSTPVEGSEEERALKLVKGVWEGVLEVAGS
ncbi:MIF4G like-domain-containing protein [Mrakia frigida]|uniref:Sto1p n=1 Tax=Mrakia frigida TaxID=29902 RepID=UPI003FCC0B5F